MPRKVEHPKFIPGTYTPAQGRLNNLYNKRSYDYITFRVRKDAAISREAIQDAAKRSGKSLNQFLLDAAVTAVDKVNEVAGDTET